MVRAVIDTNVLISGVIGSTVPGQIVGGWRQGKYILVTSPQLILEAERVLRYPDITPQFNFTKQIISDFVVALSTRGFVTPGIVSLDVIKADPADNWVLAAAVEGSANYVVTGDKKHLLPLGSYENISIISPKEFLVKINP